MKKAGAKRKDSGIGTQCALENLDQVERIRQSKGNMTRNDELKMKADQLEKLFAEHQLRVPNDQRKDGRRTMPVNTPMEQEIDSPFQMTNMILEAEPDGHSSKEENKTSTPLMETVDNQEYKITPKQKRDYILSFSNGSRGKLYQNYMLKRDAKLREDWNPEKEAKLKVMQDGIEKSRAEMKVNLESSADNKTSYFDPRQRAEKIRSYSARSALNREKPADMLSTEDKDQGEFVEKQLSKTYLGDSSSQSAQRSDLGIKSRALSTPRNASVKTPRSNGKASNSAGGRRRLPSDNPLAQSIPGCSDLRKENTKPYSTGNKAVRPQRNRARKKDVNEVKPRRAHSLKKNPTITAELNYSRSSHCVDDDFSSPLRHSKEDNDIYINFSNGVELNPFLGKGNGTDGSKSSVMEALENSHDYDDASFETKEMTDATKDKDDFETAVHREFTDTNIKGRISHESDKSANPENANSSALGGLSQASLASIVDLPTSMPALLRSMGSMQDSPADSPVSWSSSVHNPLYFPHENSDIDASGSPLGSAASWNFHTLIQNDTEAARMGKKWGAGQKTLVGGSPQSPSHKDWTKGFKRFLKFGRKTRAMESEVDWISVTTSEGDYDTGRHPANRSSEDFQKSRLGFSHSYDSDTGSNESNLLNNQAQSLQSSIQTPKAYTKYNECHLSKSSPKAPKSLFSLPKFRSKGSESKLR